MFKKLLTAGALCSGVFQFIDNHKTRCCGIIGVLSQPSEKSEQAQRSVRNNGVQNILCNGIELLKNRGYDSAGIVTLSLLNGYLQHNIVKYAIDDSTQLTCIEKVVEQVMKRVSNSVVGIGHTRWATCGGLTAKNAHPHYDEKQKIFLVHNGIISNHSTIKSEHLQGVHFSSETDSQVIVQLLGKYKQQGKNMVEALKQLQTLVSPESQWALVVVDKEKPDMIYTSTRGLPLLVGFGDHGDQLYVASEKIAFQEHADCYFAMNDREIYELRIDHLEGLKQEMKKSDRLYNIDKSKKESKDPPPPFKRFYDYELRQIGTLPFKPCFGRMKILKFGDNLTMVACGSSNYAAGTSEYFFKLLKCFKKIHIYDPVQLIPEDITENETVIFVSQSGETADLLKTLQYCKHKENVKTFGIINVEGSTLARKVDFPIYINVGIERSVAATKSFFHQSLNLIYFATEVAEQKQSASERVIAQIRSQLLNCPQSAQQTIQMCESKCKELAKLLHIKKSIYILAKRQTLPIAKEAALKIKELCYIHAEALGACQMKHGPIALINSDKGHEQETVVILYILDNGTYETMMNTMDQMLTRNAYVVIITDCLNKINDFCKKHENKKSTMQYHFAIEIPALKHLSYLLGIIPIQLLVENISQILYINRDAPRNLAKSVTV